MGQDVELCEGTECWGNHRASENGGDARTVTVEKESPPRQQQTTRKRAAEIGVGQFKSGEPGGGDQVVGEDTDPHRLTGDAHHDAYRCRRDNRPPIEKGKLFGGEGEVGCEAGHGCGVP